MTAPGDVAQRRAALWHVAWRAINVHHAQQRLDELTEVLVLAERLFPKTVVEVGSASGGTLYAWRELHAQVFAVSLTVPTVYGQLHPHGATVLEGDSHDPATLRRLKDQLVGRPVDVLFIDGDHSYEGASRDFEMYTPLVRPGGLVLVHDIAGKEPGVSRMWQDVKAQAAQAGRHTAEVVSRTNPAGFGVLFIDGDGG
jgi:cephalosporin hydroxylase